MLYFTRAFSRALLMLFTIFNIASKRSVLHCHLLAWHMHCSVRLFSILDKRHGVFDYGCTLPRKRARGARVLTAMVWNSDLLWCLLNSDWIFLRSTSQRETMILVTTFSFAPLLCAWKENQSVQLKLAAAAVAGGLW